MSTQTYDTSINYNTMMDLIPVLARLDGYAMKDQPVTSIVYSDVHDEQTGYHTGREITCIYFGLNHGIFKKVAGGWVLSLSNQPIAVFPG